MANPVLQFNSVEKSFGKKTAVQNVSFHVRPGEIYGLIGPNGSGKTTILKMIAGIYKPSAGTIHVQGMDVTESPTKTKAHIGLVPDEPSAYERLTGREFMEFVGELFGMDRAERDKKVPLLLEEFNIEELADGLFQDYSRGTRQKITILSALLHDPSLLLIDEPMVGLDPASARVAKRLMKEFAAKGGAVLMSTHSLEIADEICDRFGVLANGKLIHEGTKKELEIAAGFKKKTSLEDVYMALTGEL